MKLSIPMSRTAAGIGWGFFAFQMLVLPVILVIGNAILGSPLSDAQLNFVLFAINFILTWAIFHRYLIDCGKLSLRAPIRCLRTALFGLLIYYGGSILVGILIGYLRPDFANVNDAAIMDMTQGNYTLMAIGTVLLVPVTEEMLYRGLVFRTLHRRSRIAAYIVSIAFFAAVHVIGYIGLYDWGLLGLCLLQYVPAGFALAWAYEKADSIWAPILIHMAVNQIGISSMR